MWALQGQWGVLTTIVSSSPGGLGMVLTADSIVRGAKFAEGWFPSACERGVGAWVLTANSIGRGGDGAE